MTEDVFKFMQPSLRCPAENRQRERKRWSANRKCNRSDIFLNSRNINEDEMIASITPQKVENSRPADKEAAIPQQLTAKTKLKERIKAKEEMYVNKFLEWKKKHNEKKLKEIENKKVQKKPFVTSARIVPSLPKQTTQKSFAPKNHTFKAPANLNNPIKDMLNKNAPVKTASEDKSKSKFTRPVVLKRPAVATKKIPSNQAVVAPQISTRWAASVKTDGVAKPFSTKPNIKPAVTITAPKVARTVVKKKPTELKIVNKKKPALPLSTPVTAAPCGLTQKAFNKLLTSTRRKSSTASIQEHFDICDNRDDISPIETNTPKKTERRMEPLEEPGVTVLNATVVVESTHAPPEKKTPPLKIEDKPISYLSPFVSVSRGKVSAKTEKARRSSVYVQDSDYRATMAKVVYFRNTLSDEIDRMESMYKEWEKYKDENVESLNDHAIGMIDTSVGQTRLLITKKLMQFKGLIDKCEAHALARKNGNVPVLDKGDVGPTLSEDVEGFWSMVYLQVEQVEKRFNNLQRWRDNGWVDPDDVPAARVGAVKKFSKNTKKSAADGVKGHGISKAKRKPKVNSNNELKIMMMKARSEYMKTQMMNAQGKHPSSPVVLNSSRSRRSGSSRLSTPVRKMNPDFRKPDIWVESPAEDKENNGLFNINSGLRKSLLMFTVEDNAGTPFRKSLAIRQLAQKDNCMTPLHAPRKSILRTPGTIGKSKKVVFNETLENQSPQMLFTTDALDFCPTPNLDDQQRMYSLRNRKVKLRPSIDVIIPK